jgi:hypothetical protein
VVASFELEHQCLYLECLRDGRLVQLIAVGVAFWGSRLSSRALICASTGTRSSSSGLD